MKVILGGVSHATKHVWVIQLVCITFDPIQFWCSVQAHFNEHLNAKFDLSISDTPFSLLKYTVTLNTTGKEIQHPLFSIPEQEQSSALSVDSRSAPAANRRGANLVHPRSIQTKSNNSKAPKDPCRKKVQFVPPMFAPPLNMACGKA